MDIKKILDKLKGKNSKLKYLEEQIKSVKNKKVKEAIAKLLNELKTKKTLEEELASKEDTKKEDVSKQPVINESISEIFREIKYQRNLTPKQQTVQQEMPDKNKIEKPYSSHASYSVSTGGDYKLSTTSMYELAVQSKFRELEDTFIKEGILTSNKSPTTDQLDTLREKLRSINPSWSEERIMSYEKRIISDLKERKEKDVYVARIQ